MQLRVLTFHSELYSRFGFSGNNYSNIGDLFGFFFLSSHCCTERCDPDILPDLTIVSITVL